jgi:O-antigen ligase
MQNFPILRIGQPLAHPGGADSGLTIYAVDATAGAFLLLALLSRSRQATRPKRHPGVGFALGYAAWTLASIIWSAEEAFTLSEALRTALLGATFAALATILASESRRAAFLWGIVVAVCFQSAIGLLQWVSNSSLGFASELQTDLTDPSLSRAGAGLGHPNVLGGFLVICLPLVLSQALRAQRFLPQAFAGVTALLGLGAVIVTLSRGSYLGVTCGVLQMVFVGMRQGLFHARRYRVALVVGLIGAAAVLSQLWQPLAFRLSENDPSTVLRPYLDLTALNIAVHHPIIGIGANSFSEYIRNQPTENIGLIPLYPTVVHNIILLVLAETGVVGIALYAGWILSPAISLIKRAAAMSRLDAAVCAGVLGSITGILVAGQFDWTLRVVALEYMFMAVMAGGASLAMTFTPVSAARDQL